MAITQAFCNSFKDDMLKGVQNIDAAGDTIQIALYTVSATLSATTSAYTTTNEVTGTGYVAGGCVGLCFRRGTACRRARSGNRN